MTLKEVTSKAITAHKNLRALEDEIDKALAEGDHPAAWEMIDILQMCSDGYTKTWARITPA